jgi:putative phage-type endonuclease
LEVRQGGIGSSDAAAAVGLNPYKSQLELWLEKTGRGAAKEETTGMDDPCYWGTLLEPYVATAYQQKTGCKVRRVNAVLQHPTFNFMLANLDREVVGSPDVQILECKTAGEFGSRLWKDGVPEYVQLQVQHQLAVTGKAAADVAVLLCGQKLEIHRIERDDEVIARLIVLETTFWQCVEQGTPPPADGSESSARALRQLYPGNDTTLDFSQDEALCETFMSLSELKTELEDKGQLAEQCKQTIQQAMGDASRAVFPGGEVTFRRSKDGTSLDTKQLLADHPELAAHYTLIRPGSRRFVLSVASDP